MTYIEEMTNTKQKSNSMVASISSKILQIRKENIKQSLSDLDTLEHRQDLVATIDGVMYYDDSRAESVNATWFTFENIVRPVIWIAGGYDRETDFKDLKHVAKKKVRMLICIGRSNAILKNAFHRDIKEIYEVQSMEEAVDTASFLANADDVVLFSPACKSDVEGETFENRGKAFIDNVKRLENEHRQ